MGNVIEGLEARYDELPADLVDDCIRAFTLIAERNGGTMIRGKYQLTAKVKKRFDRKGSSFVIMAGVPSGFWTWKETGTAEHTIKPKKRRRGGKKRAGWKPGPLGGDLGHYVWGPVIHKGAKGRLAWTKTVEQADVVIRELTAKAIEKMGH
jgi:hypothetical protein